MGVYSSKDLRFSSRFRFASLPRCISLRPFWSSCDLTLTLFEGESCCLLSGWMLMTPSGCLQDSWAFWMKFLPFFYKDINLSSLWSMLMFYWYNGYLESLVSRWYFPSSSSDPSSRSSSGSFRSFYTESSVFAHRGTTTLSRLNLPWKSLLPRCVDWYCSSIEVP